MTLDDLPFPPEDDAIDKYRDDDIEQTVREAKHLSPKLLGVSAPSRRQHMLTVLKWVLAHVEEGYNVRQSRLNAFERTAEAFDLKKSTLATEVQQAYKDRKQGDGVQDLFEEGLEQFVSIWEQKQEHC